MPSWNLPKSPCKLGKIKPAKCVGKDGSFSFSLAPFAVVEDAEPVVRIARKIRKPAALLAAREIASDSVYHGLLFLKMKSRSCIILQSSTSVFASRVLTSMSQKERN